MDKKKLTMVLPYSRETTGTVIYGVKNLRTLPVGQVYINKQYLSPTGYNADGEPQWAPQIVLTVEEDQGDGE